MRGILLATPAFVCGDDGISVYGELVVGIDGDEEEPGVCLQGWRVQKMSEMGERLRWEVPGVTHVDETSVIPLPETMRDASLAEEGEVCNVFTELKTRRVLPGDVKGGYLALCAI